jgi:hypothetical protein
MTTLYDRNGSERTMEWIYLEAGIALLLLIAIVWWTVSARHKPDGSGKRGSRE